MKNKSQSQSAPEQAGNVNIPVAITRTGFQLEWCAPYYGLIDLGVPKQHPDGTKLYAIPAGYCIVPKQVLLDCDKAFTSNRVWNGQGWTQNPIHPFAFKKAAKLVRDELDRVFASPTNVPPPEISTDAVEAAGRCTACGEELI